MLNFYYRYRCNTSLSTFAAHEKKAFYSTILPACIMYTGIACKANRCIAFKQPD